MLTFYCPKSFKSLPSDSVLFYFCPASDVHISSSSFPTTFEYCLHGMKSLL